MSLPIRHGVAASERHPQFDVNFADDAPPSDSALNAIGLTFSRSGTQTFQNGYGQIDTAADGEPAYAKNSDGTTKYGLHMEPASTNKIRNTDLDASGSSANWQVSDASFDASENIAAPDAASTSGGGKYIQGKGGSSSSAAYHVFYEGATLTDGSGGGAHRNGWSASMFAKKGNVDFIGFAFSSTVKVGAAFDLSDGSIVNSANCTASVETVGGGWYRLKMENLQNIGTYGVFAFTPSSSSSLVWNDSGTGSWYSRSDYHSTTGSGFFTQYVANNLYVWGPQFEDNPTCTSYIPNPSDTASGVTRNACTLSCGTMANLQPNSTFTKGTFAINGYRDATGSSAMPTFLEFSDGSTSDTLGVNADATKEQLSIYDGSGAFDIEAGDDVARKTLVRMACAYRQADYAASLNGANAVTNTTNVLPSITNLDFGKSYNSGRELNGFLTRFRYWNDRRLPDGILKRISAS